MSETPDDKGAEKRQEEKSQGGRANYSALQGAFLDVQEVTLKGYPLVRPKVQRPAIPAVPVDAVLVPPPEVQPAFSEFLEWVVEMVKRDSEGTATTGHRVTRWTYSEMHSRGPMVNVSVDSKEGTSVENHFYVGGLAWLDTDEMWTSGYRHNIRSIPPLTDLEKTQLELIPDA